MTTTNIKQPVVIDTNVAIAANGNSDHASIDCELECIGFLEQCAKIKIALDRLDLIMDEYKKHLSYAGQPGVGDMFFKYLHDNQYDPGSRIIRVDITPCDDLARSFAELPPNTFDISDRKLLATAVVSYATVVNATDSDWEENRDLLKTLRVPIHQLCPAHSTKSNA